ncbi:MAG: hypothetical protein DI537_33640 [Stutzerimonas stutzeri]|nr:MAG: hypothetical protein DI537_33640 [Stutzerimonas stutzeri]
MVPRKLFADPQDLKKLANAFDEAWISVNNFAPIVAEDQAAARHRLAQIVLRLWHDNPEGEWADWAVIEFVSQRPDTKERR